MPGARRRRQNKTSQRVARMRVALVALAAWAAAGRAHMLHDRPIYPDANKRALTPPSPIGRSTDDATTLAAVRAHDGARTTRRPPLFRRSTSLRECVTYPDGNY